MTDPKFRRLCWEGSLPFEFHLSPQDCRRWYNLDSSEPVPPVQPLSLRMYRKSYLPLYAPKLFTHFQRQHPSVLFAGNPNQSQAFKTSNNECLDMWFEFKGTPLKWNIPIGVLFDSLAQTQFQSPLETHSFNNFKSLIYKSNSVKLVDTLPWKVVVHLSNYPISLSSLPPITSNTIQQTVQQFIHFNLESWWKNENVLIEQESFNTYETGSNSDSDLFANVRSKKIKSKDLYAESIRKMLPLCLRILQLREYYQNQLKQAVFVCYKSVKPLTFNMGAANQKNLFRSIIDNNSDQFWNINVNLIHSNDPEFPLLRIPCKFYFPNLGLQDLPFYGNLGSKPLNRPKASTFLQFPTYPEIKLPNNPEPTPVVLGAVLFELFPSLFPNAPGKRKKVEKNCDGFTVSCHGILPPLDTPIRWLWEYCSYPDNFLHLVIHVVDSNAPPREHTYDDQSVLFSSQKNVSKSPQPDAVQLQTSIQSSKT